MFLTLISDSHFCVPRYQKAKLAYQKTERMKARAERKLQKRKRPSSDDNYNTPPHPPQSRVRPSTPTNTNRGPRLPLPPSSSPLSLPNVSTPSTAVAPFPTQVERTLLLTLPSPSTSSTCSHSSSTSSSGSVSTAVVISPAATNDSGIGKYKPVRAR